MSNKLNKLSLYTLSYNIFLLSECFIFAALNLILNIISYFVTESLKKMPNNNNNNAIRMQLFWSVTFLHLTTNLHCTLSPSLHEAKRDWVAGSRDWVPQNSGSGRWKVEITILETRSNETKDMGKDQVWGDHI